MSKYPPSNHETDMALTDTTTLALAAHHFRVACSNCNLRELCLPVDLSPDLRERLTSQVAQGAAQKRVVVSRSFGTPFWARTARWPFSASRSSCAGIVQSLTSGDRLEN